MFSEQILAKVKSYIPVYWPLQSFIATNPLFGLVDKPFDKCISDIGRYVQINGALPIDKYHNYYANGKISLNSLRQATKDFLLDNNIFNEEAHDKLLNLLINRNNQIALEELFKNTPKHQSFLISDFVESDSNYLDSKKNHVRVGHFIADFLDLGQAKWQMPVNTSNIYNAWLEYCSIEDKYIKNAVKDLPVDSFDAISFLITKLEIPDKFLEQYLIAIVFRILGWFSLVNWLEDRPDNPYINKSAKVSDILAIWLSLEYALSLEFNYKFNSEHFIAKVDSNLEIDIFKKYLSEEEPLYNVLNLYAINLIWQSALEKNYQFDTLNQIKLSNNSYSKINTTPPQSQLVLCIDTRSEGLRRKLEGLGNHETFGFAGFFGIGFSLYDENTDSCSFQCPAIVKPDIKLINKISNQTFTNKIRSGVYKSLNKVKEAFLSPLVLFDMIGLYFALGLILKTLFPTVANKYLNNKQNNIYSDESLDVFAPTNGFTKISLAEKASFVLNAIGLVDNFAPFVIIAGHIAESENNPFHSSLDCGACGGNGGIPNAIAFCQGLNDTEVRDILRDKYNISIPPTTFFVSACHNTTLDKFTYYNLSAMNDLQSNLFTTTKNDINLACELLREERLLALYGDKNVNNRKSNWAELIPEMALANNAAIIIGPRQITKNINLDRRTFLHSYNPDLDPNGDILSFIFNAPVLVAHWINSQYYFSTTDKDIYGAGNKAIHNLIGQFGVMEGNFSDYKIGLPEQSIFYRNQLMHEPLRLTVFVYADKKMVNKIINESQLLRNLFNGRWIHLEILDPNEFNVA